MPDRTTTPPPVDQGKSPPVAPGGPTAPANQNLPTTIPAPPPRAHRRRWLGYVVVLLLLVAGGGGGAYWWLTRPVPLPAGIASGNGRLEADEIDIATKFAGRVATLDADEGDRVKAGQVVARMDVRDFEAQLGKAQATVQEAQKALDQARAQEAQQRSAVVLARQQLARARTLTGKGFMSRETLDQRRQQMDSAAAAYSAASAQVGALSHALDAARHDVDVLKINIADNTLVAPVDGRIQYKLSNIGEVLPAGGKVFTMLDTSYVYMDIYLPTLEAGKVMLGAPGLIVLDALPKLALPAKVVFLATEAQFTPKTVETKTERDKLMFRVRLRLDPAFVRKYADAVRTGLPGVGYVRLDSRVAWPPWLGDRIAR